MFGLIDTAFLIDSETGETLRCACGLKERIKLEYRMATMNIEVLKGKPEGYPKRYFTHALPNIYYHGIVTPFNHFLILN